jgi:hypothetical protein
VLDIAAGLGLHPPQPHGHRLDISEDEILHDHADEDHRQQARRHRRDIEHVLVLIDVPAQPAFAGGDAENELGRDQRAPGESPADLGALAADAGQAAQAFARVFFAASMSIALIALALMEEKPLQADAEVEAQ